MGNDHYKNRILFIQTVFWNLHEGLDGLGDLEFDAELVLDDEEVLDAELPLEELEARPSKISINKADISNEINSSFIIQEQKLMDQKWLGLIWNKDLSKCICIRRNGIENKEVTSLDEIFNDAKIWLLKHLGLWRIF